MRRSATSHQHRFNQQARAGHEIGDAEIIANAEIISLNHLALGDAGQAVAA
jgi:hypothetical protein